MDNQKICRTCAKKGNCTNLLTFLFSEEAENLDLRAKLKKYTPVELHENDNLPKSICGECKTRITDWHSFWDNCLKVEHNLKLMRDDSLKEERTSVENSNTLAKTSQPDIENTNVGTLNVQQNNKIDPVRSKKQRGFYCIARWCNSNNATSKMFRIPKDKRCHVWLTRAGREDLKNLDVKWLNNKYLCEKHFTDNMFNNSNKNSLIWDALPTIFQIRNRCGSVSSTEGTVKVSSQPHLRNFRTLLVKQPSLLKSPSVKQQKDVTPTPVANFQIIQYPLPMQLQDSNEPQRFIILNTSGLENQGDKTVRLQQSSVDSVLIENSCNNFKTVLKKQTIQHDITTAGCSQNTETSCSATKRHSSVSVTENAFSESGCSIEEKQTSINTKKQKIVPKTKVLNPCSIVLVDSLENLKEGDVDSLCSGHGFKECMYPCLACGEVFLMKSSLAQHRKTYHDDLSTY